MWLTSSHCKLMRTWATRSNRSKFWQRRSSCSVIEESHWLKFFGETIELKRPHGRENRTWEPSTPSCSRTRTFEDESFFLGGKIVMPQKPRNLNFISLRVNLEFWVLFNEEVPYLMEIWSYWIFEKKIINIYLFVQMLELMIVLVGLRFYVLDI